MIDLINVGKSYDGRPILSNFSLSIKKNEFVSIVGPSGAGKTTVLNLIGLLDNPDYGVVKIGGISNPNKKEVMQLRRVFFGYVFQNYVLMDNDTVLNNLLISKTYNTAFNEKAMVDTLEKVGLNTNLLNKKIYQLSGGEQQRVALARVLLKPFEIILADEPTGNLDDINKQIVVNLLHEMRNIGKTIVCVTHDAKIANQSDRVIQIIGEGE
ncbi:ATP-binding cassette domain-containing protein [Paenibacillus sp. AD87]|uniref:ATP-binding cassette domain-containing protein n=1 Tax=Paenibacillus sp. AD87 TaxID=1528787 RepID=UPI0007E4DA5C|nr:ATP-binding cassette domain-containing protein [Paenibacillus sp. AD87]OAX50894.1 Lipoprotein-releasing system ATP-binding protein LolD [Paenibacillus sp. AD87]